MAMLIILGGAALFLGLGAIVWAAGRSPRATRGDRPVAVVSADEAKAALYPYVFVNDLGSVRELHANEKQFLATPFHVRDTRRPYVKATYEQRNQWGNLSGYCHRAAIPKHRAIGYPPIAADGIETTGSARAKHVSEDPAHLHGA